MNGSCNALPKRTESKPEQSTKRSAVLVGPDAELKNGASQAVRLTTLQLQIAVQVNRHAVGRPLADGDDADARRPEDRDNEVRQTVPQRDGGQEARASSAQYKHLLDHDGAR